MYLLQFGKGLGPESVYQKAMIIELTKDNLKVEAEKPLKVYYDNQIVTIVELKFIQNLAKEHACPVECLPACGSEADIYPPLEDPAIGAPNLSLVKEAGRRIDLSAFLPERQKDNKIQ